jgi:GT2 family glycosyltransferase
VAPEPDCSIIVPVYNHAPLTRRCVADLLESLPASIDWELIIVDDASEDDTAEMLAEFEDGITTVRRDANGGFAKACNDGASRAAGRFLVFLNNDTEPREHWLEALIDYAAIKPEAAVVGSKLLYANGTVQHAGIVITQERFPRHIYGCFPGDHPAVSKSRSFQCVTGAAMLVRSEVFLEAGGFDSAYLNAYEDIDLCLRLGRAGHEVHLCAESVLTHLETVTRDFSDYEQNHQLYLSRWGDSVQPDDLHYYLEDGLLELEYWDQFPIKLKVSPLLAEVVTPDGEQTAAEIATARARQVFELLRENAHLRVRLIEEAERAARVAAEANHG